LCEADLKSDGGDSILDAPKAEEFD